MMISMIFRNDQHSDAVTTRTLQCWCYLWFLVFIFFALSVCCKVFMLLVICHMP